MFVDELSEQKSVLKEFDFHYMNKLLTDCQLNFDFVQNVFKLSMFKPQPSYICSIATNLREIECSIFNSIIIGNQMKISDHRNKVTNTINKILLKFGYYNVFGQ